MDAMNMDLQISKPMTQIQSLINSAKKREDSEDSDFGKSSALLKLEGYDPLRLFYLSQFDKICKK